MAFAAGFAYHCGAMNTPNVTTRFAPSPTGLLHLGNLRTALFNALFARGNGGRFLLRIEDTDQTRSKTEFVEHLKEDLRWLGLDWAEGPDCDGPSAPYFQSQRGDVYDAHYRKLEEADLVYPCFCSEKELELLRRAQLQSGQPPRYTGTCAHLSEDERQARRDKGIQPTLRFRVPKGVTVEFEDVVRGRQKFVSDDIGDFIIRRADGTPAFFFTNAVDDALMGVTHVMRGDDHLTNTPRQMMLLDALGLNAPQYAHISMIVGDDGAPLSKRHGSRSLQELRAEGFHPLGLLNYLARLGHYYPDNDCFDLDGLANAFKLESLGRAPARFDESQLRYWQEQALNRLDMGELLAWAAPALGDVEESQRETLLAAVRENITFPSDVQHWVELIQDDLPALDDESLAVLKEAGPDFFVAAMKAVDDGATDFKGIADGVKAVTGAKGRGLFMPLRVALTGQRHGPDMGPLVSLMGAQTVKDRLLAAETAAA